MNIIFGIKQSGPDTFYNLQRPAIIQRGQYLKLGMLLLDSSFRPFVITAYTITLRIKNEDDSTLELIATHIDNNKGEVEFVIVPSESSAMKLGAAQSVEVELKVTATPTLINFYPVLAALSVSNKAI